MILGQTSQNDLLRSLGSSLGCILNLGDACRGGVSCSTPNIGLPAATGGRPTGSNVPCRLDVEPRQPLCSDLVCRLQERSLCVEQVVLGRWGRFLLTYTARKRGHGCRWDQRGRSNHRRCRLRGSTGSHGAQNSRQSCWVALGKMCDDSGELDIHWGLHMSDPMPRYRVEIQATYHLGAASRRRRPRDRMHGIDALHYV